MSGAAALGMTRSKWPLDAQRTRTGEGGMTDSCCQNVCPKCGYCPHCGRCNHPHPYADPYPWTYPQPYYVPSNLYPWQRQRYITTCQTNGPGSDPLYST
jgi:hypothetical protein